jgi:hypothetical protein
MTTTTVKLWRVGGTDKAYLFSTLPKGDSKGRCVWIPRSQISHVSAFGPSSTPSEWQPCVVEVADWLAEKENL